MKLTTTQQDILASITSRTNIDLGTEISAPTVEMYSKIKMKEKEKKKEKDRERQRE